MLVSAPRNRYILGLRVPVAAILVFWGGGLTSGSLCLRGLRKPSEAHSFSHYPSNWIINVRCKHSF